MVLTFTLGLKMCGRAQVNALSGSSLSQTTSASSIAKTKPDFDTQIKPIFQARCQPCHFPGGKVYDHLPFDRPETITRLGEKLFTRIKDKEEQRLIREFLSQP
jgi:hypothetical protein